MKKNTLIHPTAAMVKTEHNFSFIWNFISLNQPLCSSTQLLSKQVDFPVSISQFPRTGESPPLGSLDQSQRGAICRQGISLVRILGTLGERKQGSGIRGCCPLSACRQTQGVGLSLTEEWDAGCSSPWLGRERRITDSSYLFLEKWKIWDAFL